MKAFVLSDPAAGLIRPAEVPVPRVGEGELLVRLRAVGVGIHDSSFLPAAAGPDYPIGIEGAGIVEAVGGGVSGYGAGDRIAFVSSMQPKGGTWAEYAVVDAQSLILPIPAGLDFARAAALPVAGNTALRAFAALGAMPERASIFVAGGSGAIGTLAIQLAHRRGRRVGASASARNHQYLRSLGAEHVVDYHDGGWVEEVRRWVGGGIDAAIAVQPGTSAEAMRVVADGGRLVTVSGDEVMPERGIAVTMVDYRAQVRADLIRLMADVVANEVHVEIERVYPFDDAAEALARVRTRHARGKLVLRLPAAR
ncbi:zinc-binding dehydrogenase [Pseudactinotalea sp. HY160]|uniref:NADP-dependent oxidoreductase n=1 Tax=Pseudactinotalea sp. HY160 TaxID=2654490 RepID=UPI0013103405|nr:zinc-binding dehydrogenase [Pseudactinotalea sp. HY160]